MKGVEQTDAMYNHAFPFPDDQSAAKVSNIPATYPPRKAKDMRSESPSNLHQQLISFLQACHLSFFDRSNQLAHLDKHYQLPQLHQQVCSTSRQQTANERTDFSSCMT